MVSRKKPGSLRQTGEGVGEEWYRGNASTPVPSRLLSRLLSRNRGAFRYRPVVKGIFPFLLFFFLSSFFTITHDKNTFVIVKIFLYEKLLKEFYFRWKINFYILACRCKNSRIYTKSFVKILILVRLFIKSIELTRVFRKLFLKMYMFRVLL